MSAQEHAVRQAIFLSFGMILLASTTVAATKYASAHVSIEAIVTLQYFICTVLCLPGVLRHGVSSLRTQRPGLHLFRGIVGVLGFYLFYATLANVAMVDAMLLRQSAPLAVPLVMWVWSRDKVTASAWLPLTIGFSGIAIILRPSPLGLSWWHVAGFFSAITLAISMVATHRLATTEPTHRILFYYVVISLVCVTPFGIDDFSGLSWRHWLAMVYIGVSIYAVLELYTRAYGMASASAIAPINYFAVPFAGLWGWVFWDQIPDSWSLLGGTLVITGGLLTIYLAGTKPRNTKPGSTAAESKHA